MTTLATGHIIASRSWTYEEDAIADTISVLVTIRKLAKAD